ncbi:MAG: MerR family transcriptional regulator [Defluviitaleaceae bacterium]|nr:MerR family transcriptional regulator [Defluviitaleaceae bacterium]
MNDLTKIKDVSSKYAVTARTLRYYEDIGLLSSLRTEDYAHRMYDERAITRLKQILILRKLNITVKDIKRIFAAADSDVVLEVLGKKAEDIDEEIALLYELKTIVLEFIEQIKKSDFHNEEEIKMLYDKAKEIETQLTAQTQTETGEANDVLNDTNDASNEANDAPNDANDASNASNAERLLEVTEKLEDKRITLPIPVNAYKQSVGATRFIGKKYASGGEAWEAWTDEDGNRIKSGLGVDLNKTEGLRDDGDALIGLMSHRNGFEYWLGYFTPFGTPVPEGYEYEDFPKMDIGVCWLYGYGDELFAIEDMAFDKLKDEGYAVDDYWWFERYHPVRNQSDKKGFGIIDICFFIK